MKTTALYGVLNNYNTNLRSVQRNITSKRSPLLPQCHLNATSLEPLPEYLLEEGNVIEVHQGVVLAGYVSEGGTVFAAFLVTTAEVLPGLELLVQPVGLGSLEGNGVEDVQDLCNNL